MATLRPIGRGHLLHNAAVLARLARLAYEDPQTIIRRTLDLGWPHVLPFAHGEAAGLAAWDDYFLTLAIRGTDSLADFRQDARVQYAHFGTFVVHHGFLEHARAIRSILESLPGSDIPRTLPTILTGHSLGGAAAVLMALQPPIVRGLALDVRKVVTFGAPRCLAPSSAGRYVHPPVYRFVRCGDLVPDLPYRRLGVDYAHVGTCYAMVGRGKVEGEGCHWWHRVWRKVRYGWAVWRCQLTDAVRRDHSMAVYEDWLEPFLDGGEEQ